MRFWPRRRPPPSRSRVLVVDDDETLRNSMARLLRHAGFEVETTPDPRWALARLSGEGTPVHVVVCDVVMPIMNGIVFGERLREMELDIPLIYVSGLAEESALRDWGVPASTPFLAKPFEPEAFVALVSRVACGAAAGGERAGEG